MSLLRKVRMVRGPARVTVRGKCMLLGAEVSNSVVEVRAGKALPFEPKRYCKIQIKTAQGGRAWGASPFDAGTFIWKDIPREILTALEQRGKLAILVIGSGDTGKSTFCTYLANSALRRGIAPCFVDGDIGQGDIAPPSAMGAAVLTQQLTDLRDCTARLFGFVGAISPAGIEPLVADRLSDLYQQSRDLARLLIINTDGYSQNGGIRYKRMIADSIQPNMIILLGRNQPLASALISNSWRLVEARSSEHAIKSWTERRWRRHDQFLRFAGKGQIHVPLANIEFKHLGKMLLSSDLSSISTIDSGLGLRGVFVGLGLKGSVVGFGVIGNIGRDFVELHTDLRDFDTIHLSNIRLTGGMAEQITLEMPGPVSQEN